MSDESNYIVTTPRLVMGYLAELIQKKCLISANFGDKKSSFLTSILELDKKNHILLLDCGPTKALDDELLASDKILFRANCDGIEVSFKGEAIRKIKKHNTWVFAMPVPNSIFWLQRRHFYRIKVPMSHQGSYCRISYSADGEQIVLPLIDLSISGVALLNSDLGVDWATRLSAGHQWGDSHLYLQSGESCEVTLNVVYINEIRASTTQFHQRIGCYFEKLPVNFDSAIQRYMHEIELLYKNIA